MINNNNVNEHSIMGLYEKYNPQVVSFITNILDDNRNNNDQIRSFFRSGYCWHFAKILQSTFGRGTVCMTYPLGHMVWVDIDGLAYDIEGPYEMELHDVDMFLPESFLSGTLCAFTHIPNTSYKCPEDFRDWAKDIGKDPVYMMTQIFIDIPDKSNIDYNNQTLEEVVLEYWIKNKDMLTECYKSK